MICHLLLLLLGDSAGGLILTGVTLLCIELGLRIPDGLLLVYTPQLLESSVSPARLLSLADPLIPYPALAACLGGNYYFSFII
jgi:hormone-sensitive lipase